MNVPLKFAAGFWVGAVIIVAGISTIGGALAVQRLDTAANHIKDIVSSDGVYAEAEQDTAASYLQRVGLGNATISVTSDNGDVSAMSLGDPFTVTLTQPVKIGVGGIGFTLLTLPGHAEGLSEVYRK